MLETIAKPENAKYYKFFLIGILYASLSIILTRIFFFEDPVLIRYSGLIVVTFCVMFTLIYTHRLLKIETEKDEEVKGILDVWRVHQKTIYSLLIMFLGFVIAFSFWYFLIGNSTILNAQIETYCSINRPGAIDDCVLQFSQGDYISPGTGFSVKMSRLGRILENNFLVMIFTLIFALIFGAGAMFILAWNATVIASAIGVYSNYSIAKIPLGIARYMIHGIPEIANYVIATVAGTMIGISIHKHGIKSPQFLKTFQNSIILLVIGIIILLIAGIIEVFITPLIF